VGTLEVDHPPALSRLSLGRRGRSYPRWPTYENLPHICLQSVLRSGLLSMHILHAQYEKNAFDFPQAAFYSGAALPIREGLREAVLAAVCVTPVSMHRQAILSSRSNIRKEAWV